MAPQRVRPMQELARHGLAAACREPRPGLGHSRSGRRRRKGKVLYVWVRCSHRLYQQYQRTAARLLGEMVEIPETRLVHFIGKDNIVFHCIVFPAMLKAEGSLSCPTRVPSNEFLNLEGDKISTSRNWARTGHEYLEDFPGKQDVLRYVLTANSGNKRQRLHLERLPGT